MLFARTFVFSFLLLASPQICEIGLDLTSRIMALLEIPDAIDVHLVDSGLFGTLSAAWLLVIIFDIIIMFKVLKLLLEVAERHVILAVLSMTAPLAFSMGGSKSTSEIFTGWCRMFGSICLLMVMNVMFFKMLLSVVSTVPSGLDVFPWMVLIVTIVKIAKKADEIITRIGLNPAITGDRGKGFGSVLAYTMLRSATSKVIRTVGAAATGGASAATGAAAGGVKAAAGAAGMASRGGGQKGQGSTSPQEQQGGPASSGGTKDAAGNPFGQSPHKDGPSRKSSVPPGTRRAASHISAGTTEGASVPETSGPRGGRGSDRDADRSATSGGSFGRGGGFNGSAGRDTRKGPGRNGAGRLRPINVLADDFDDSSESAGPGPSGISGSGSAGSGSAATGGVRSGGAGGPAGSMPPSMASRKTDVKRTETTIKDSASEGHSQTGGRSTRRPALSPAPSAATRPGPADAGGHSSTQAASLQKQRGGSTVRQEQRSVSSSIESSVKKARDTAAYPSPAGTGAGTDGGKSRSKRQGPAPVRQEASGQAASSGSPVKDGGSIAPPGPAGSGSGSERPRRSRDRSPSPARQEGSKEPKGVIQKSGAPSIHPGTAGIGGGSPTQTSAPKERSSSPVRQELAAVLLLRQTRKQNSGASVRTGRKKAKPRRLLDSR